VNDSRLFDPGLQPERTGLAWRRTLLTLAVGALIALRLLPPALGPWSIGVGILGLLVWAVLWWLASRRAHDTQHALVTASAPLPDGRLLLVLALVVAATAGLGLGALALIVTSGGLR
jgi:putative membrane protein